MLNVLKKTLAVSIVAILVCSLFFSVSVKPASATGNSIYWGAWVGGSGTHQDGHKMPYFTLTDFEGQVGKNVSIWNWIQLWNRPQDQDNCPTFRSDWMDSCRNNGIIPMVSWSPEASDGDPNFHNLQDIIDGKEDAYLTTWGKASAAWGHPYFVRLMWEFTGSWTDNTLQSPGYGIYPWGNGNTPAIFVAAWQHIVDAVRAAGGTQISWVWCVAGTDDSVDRLRTVYPGDSYVDWIGNDVYLSKGQTFHSWFFDNIRIVSPHKPVMIPELGYTGSDSGSFWNNLLTDILPNNYPYIKAVVVWEMPSHGLTVVDSKTLTSFKQAIGTDYYISNIYSNLNVFPINALSATNPTLDSTSPSPTITITPLSSINLPVIVIIVVIIAIMGAIVILAKRRH